MPRLLIASLIALTGLFIQAQAQYGRNDPVVVDRGMDHFAVGGNVAVSAPVAGDLVAAGRSVVSESSVGCDAVAAGGSVRLSGTVSRDAYAAGGQVLVEGTISRNARLAGGNVEIAPSSRIEGGVSLAAGQGRVAARSEATSKQRVAAFTSTLQLAETWTHPPAS